jgi:hypothetical protein
MPLGWRGIYPQDAIQCLQTLRIETPQEKPDNATVIMADPNAFVNNC